MRAWLQARWVRRGGSFRMAQLVGALGLNPPSVEGYSPRVGGFCLRRKLITGDASSDEGRDEESDERAIHPSALTISISRYVFLGLGLRIR